MEQPPVYVKIDKYKELATLLDTIDKKITDSDAMLAQLKKLKAEEDAQMVSWESTLKDVETRSAELHHTLFMK